MNPRRNTGGSCRCWFCVDGGAITDSWTRGFHLDAVMPGHPACRHNAADRGSLEFARPQPSRLPQEHSSASNPPPKHLQQGPDEAGAIVRHRDHRPNCIFYSGLAPFHARLAPKPSVFCVTPPSQMFSRSHNTNEGGAILGLGVWGGCGS